VPSAYQPPLLRRAQAVRTTRRASHQRWRWWWVVPVLGLLPVVVAAVLASEGRFGAAGRGPAAGTPVASAPLTQVQATPGQPRPTQTAAEPAATRTPAESAGNAAATQAVAVTPTTASNPAPAVANPAPAVSNAQPAISNAPSAVSNAQSDVSNTQVASPRATSGPFQAYRVQPGDSVRVIAQAFGVSSASIAQASGLRNADQLRVGQVLTIPNQTGWLYRIQPGETLNQIAARTGVPTEIIASASMLSDEAVQAGDVILIPEQRVTKSK